MSELWISYEEGLEQRRKNALLIPALPLQRGGQAVVRCAECILARPAAEGESPSFTHAEVQRCTGLAEGVVTPALDRIIKGGWLIKKAGDSIRPATYEPRAKDGVQFFKPTTKPGCERTAKQNTLESLTNRQLEVLACLGHRATITDQSEQPRATQMDINDCIGAGPTTVRYVFRSLCARSILKQVIPEDKRRKRQRPMSFILTEWGSLLAQDLESPRGCQLQEASHPDAAHAKSPVVDVLPPRKTSPSGTGEKTLEETERLQAIKSFIVDKVQSEYPSEFHNMILRTIGHHLTLGVLEVTGDENTRSLKFTGAAAHYLNRPGQQQAVAHWLNLDKLLYGQRLRAADVGRLCNVSPDTSLGRFIQEKYYEPMLAEVQVLAGSQD